MYRLSSTQKMLFGGMFGYGYNKSKLEQIKYLNSVTNQNSCPNGYTATQVLGTINVDYPIFYCYKIVDSKQTSEYDFGGLYGYGYDTVTSKILIYKNPLTGSDSCPISFKAVQVLGTENIDYNLFYCIRNHINDGQNFSFHGMYGYGYKFEDENRPITYPHILTGTDTCPANSTPLTFLGTTTIDYSVIICQGIKE